MGESSHSTDRTAAERLFGRQMAEAMTNHFVGSQNVRMDVLLQDVVHDYRTNDGHTTKDVERHWKLHLAEYFSQLKTAMLITGRKTIF